MLYKNIFHMKVKLYFCLVFVNLNCFPVFCFTGKQVDVCTKTCIHISIFAACVRLR